MPSPAADVDRSAEGTWHAISPVDVPGEGRVRSVTVHGRSIALTPCGQELGALENRCPHQGGPLGEGSIEKACWSGTPRCTTRTGRRTPSSAVPPGIKVTSRDQLDDAMAALFAAPAPALLCVEQDAELL